MSATVAVFVQFFFLGVVETEKDNGTPLSLMINVKRLSIASWLVSKFISQKTMSK